MQLYQFISVASLIFVSFVASSPQNSDYATEALSSYSSYSTQTYDTATTAPPYIISSTYTSYIPTYTPTYKPSESTYSTLTESSTMPGACTTTVTSTVYETKTIYPHRRHRYYTTKSYPDDTYSPTYEPSSSDESGSYTTRPYTDGPMANFIG
ncbi:hypothetical protein BKA69DRAFT_1056900 [Paraphysoderma sedebokerense]|nr:hypothetical protein BKA69DRAFT_1056900 [Paraphysoderma sedebokerense]